MSIRQRIGDFPRSSHIEAALVVSWLTLERVLSRRNAPTTVRPMMALYTYRLLSALSESRRSSLRSCNALSLKLGSEVVVHNGYSSASTPRETVLLKIAVVSHIARSHLC